MARVTETEIHGHIVYTDAQYAHRWLDVVGPNAVKWREEFVTFPIDDTSKNPTAYTTTEVGTCTIALAAGADAGNCVITTGATENNGLQIQALGEAFKLVQGYPFYLGAKFALSDVSEVDAAVGLSITDTTLLADGATDTFMFRTDDDVSVMHLIVEQDSAETLAAGYTLTDGAVVTAEVEYDGEGTATVYINGIEVATVSDQDANWPSDEYLTPTIAILTGETAANTFTLEWARIFQIRN